MSTVPVFEFVTPERLQQTRLEVNWSVCFLCQNDNVNNLRFPHRKKGKFVDVFRSHIPNNLLALSPPGCRPSLKQLGSRLTVLG